MALKITQRHRRISKLKQSTEQSTAFLCEEREDVPDNYGLRRMTHAAGTPISVLGRKNGSAKVFYRRDFRSSFGHCGYTP